jgi:DNA-binding beta-propeller fold protein YncE
VSGTNTRFGILSCFLFLTQFLHAGTVYGLRDGDPGELYTIDKSTGAATLVTQIQGYSSLVGLEYMSGKLYATDIFGDSNLFGTIDPITGAFTGISDQGFSVNWHSLAGDESANLLYTIDFDSSHLLSITPTGTITDIGASTFMSGLAFDSINSILYGADGSSLFTINTATGAATAVGAFDATLGNIGLAFDPSDGILYMNDSLGNFYTVNTGTGAATLIGSNGVDNINGLAVIPDSGGAVPEPGTSVLAASALVALGFRYRKTLTIATARQRR